MPPLPTLPLEGGGQSRVSTCPERALEGAGRTGRGGPGQALIRAAALSCRFLGLPAVSSSSGVWYWAPAQGLMPGVFLSR